MHIRRFAYVYITNRYYIYSFTYFDTGCGYGLQSLFQGFTIRSIRTIRNHRYPIRRNNISYTIHWRFEMIIDMGRLSKEELIEALSKALKQISKLVDENNKLKEKLSETERT